MTILVGFTAWLPRRLRPLLRRLGALGPNYYFAINPSPGGVSPPNSPLSPDFSAFTRDMRKLFASPSIPSTLEDLEDGARRVADEDKRRRNTAASARFRVKKKLREQELERATKELT